MALALLNRFHVENDFEPVRLLTLRQAAEVPQVSMRAIHHMLWRNKLPAVKVGSQWRIRESDLTKFIHPQEEL